MKITTIHLPKEMHAALQKEAERLGYAKQISPLIRYIISQYLNQIR